MAMTLGEFAPLIGLGGVVIGAALTFVFQNVLARKHSARQRSSTLADKATDADIVMLDTLLAWPHLDMSSRANAQASVARLQEWAQAYRKVIPQYEAYGTVAQQVFSGFGHTSISTLAPQLAQGLDSAPSLTGDPEGPVHRSPDLREQLDRIQDFRHWFIEQIVAEMRARRADDPRG